MTTSTCTRCAAAAVRTLGTEDLCGACAEQILAPIRARVIERDGPTAITTAVDGSGIGRQNGPLRPDYAPGWADLACDQCGATWVGLIGQACAWCQAAIDGYLNRRRTATLTPPAVHSDDRRRPRVLATWVERLDWAVEAELISVQDASNAYRKAVGRERAA